MERYKVKKWGHIQDLCAYDKEWPRVILVDKRSFSSLTCIIYQRGKVVLNTAGEGNKGIGEDGGRTLGEWGELFEEIRSVKNHYYKKE